MNKGVLNAAPTIRTLIVREQLMLLGIVAVYGLVAICLARLHGLEGAVAVALYGDGILIMLTAYVTFAVIGSLLRIVFVERPPYPLRSAAEKLRRSWSSGLPVRILSGLGGTLLLSLLMSIYSSWKIMLPELNAFSWDSTFHAWDLWLHGGLAPWRWLQPVLGIPLVTTFVNAIYHAWIFVVCFAFFSQAFASRNMVLRTQFMLGFFLSWILTGSVIATLLASAGPCYFAEVTGLATPYAELEAYLQAVDTRFRVWALDVQSALWADYQDGQLAVGRGISAMPSMHVATAMLVFLLARSYGRIAGMFGLAFVGMIVVGSVHLAWHYAVDAYVAICVTWLIWKFSGYCSHALHRCGPVL